MKHSASECGGRLPASPPLPFWPAAESPELEFILGNALRQQCLTSMKKRLFFLSAACIATALSTFHSAHACTVFTITDGQNVLFCDNEDFSNPRTRVWFIPGTSTQNGCVLLGFDDGWGQNGLNDKGLAYGWVAGFKERWKQQPDMKTVRGNSCQRMLETCTKVEEAVAFYQQHWEESFSYGQLLVADRTGKSVVLRARDERLHAPIVKRSQGIGHKFGLRGNEAAALLDQISTPSLPDAVRMLNATLQEGVNATKYSVVFNLPTCDVYLYRFPDRSTPVHFELTKELEKGSHYFDVPELPRQLKQELRPLTEDMKKH
jgi:hypothetical protein